ncbi:MAG: signal recognition particle-docking protein FtsY [Mogibacterium sp.]|nr:signal recognition particle-docking protein FtsY [Mogibacterium sp.]MBR3331396.1 signal recognition particle-docking protein FtsY [Mogibacterium sp.]MBR4089441.1 signal recognition particle-docking protein FtsY [Mogibacterium sp.]
MALFEKKSVFRKFIDSITMAVYDNPELGPEFLDQLEESLVMADVGIDTSAKIIEELNKAINYKYITREREIKKELSRILEELMDKGERNLMKNEFPLVILMIGINGGGKTTTIAKLANMYIQQGKTVMLAAADTFRAAAAEQLELWGQRVGVEKVIRREEGADPTAVIYDAIQSAKANNVDVLICDTAGRLQNKTNLMKELEKMSRVITREWPEATRENLLVVDATSGKNAVNQAEEFNNIADITGIVLTKMDGTARGGITVTITDEFDMPIKFIGVGEKMSDLEPFNAHDFVEGIFDE